MANAIRTVMPNNKTSFVMRKSNGCVDISCYSNRWEELLGWQAGKGSKFYQKVSIPEWIFNRKNFAAACLKGLIETDGSIYRDRGYWMVNFVTTIPKLADDAMKLFLKTGFRPNLYKLNRSTRTKYTIRLSQDADRLVKLLQLAKN